ncbi:MAG TPA: LytTR family DNA-binding domain-containing protein [Saprospiraceae bacterium]|nr:LytTR family DNA-binding domain-containing protein [Saprospiraceae bacterium]HNL39690.1 LytTR family DNA-binding domain-containing protein [Saprospiraceae bacterium]HNM25026.1 LytTR family DNA-binding domain-containing protein [Saprospiraceae bacterium]
MPNSLTCLIADNDKYDRQKLALCIENFRDFPLSVVGSCENGRQAFTFLREKHVDILFLDMDMPEMDGPSLLTVLADKNVKPMVCIVTVGELDPYQSAWTHKEFTKGLLFKPFKQEDFDAEMRKILRFFPGTRITLFFVRKENKRDKREREIDFESISHISCEREEKTFHLYHADSSIELLLHIQHTMDELQTMLPSETFFRVHQSFIVNRKFIREYHPIKTMISVTGVSKLIPISQRNKRSFEHWFRQNKPRI